MFSDVVGPNGTEKSDVVVTMVTGHLVMAGSVGTLNEKRYLLVAGVKRLVGLLDIEISMYLLAGGAWTDTTVILQHCRSRYAGA